jgi:hypothetical protein
MFLSLNMERPSKMLSYLAGGGKYAKAFLDKRKARWLEILSAHSGALR